MSVDKIEVIKNNIDLIQSGIITLNTLMKPKDDNPENQPILTASKVLIDSLNGCIERMNNTYKKYNNEIVKSGTKMVNSLNKDYKTVLDSINDVHKELDEYKKDGESMSTAVDVYSKRNNKQPRLCFNSDIEHSYKFDVELMKKYPGSYFWSAYMNPQMWTIDGDINIDHSGENYDNILKYMKNDIEDDSLINDLKNMDVKKRKEFVNDLDFLSLPVKMNYMNELCFDEDIMKMKAWKKRIIMMNGKNVPNINLYLKKHGLFDTLFNKNTIDNIKYYKDNNIMYINMMLNYSDIIEDYCKNGVINTELIEREGYNTIIDNFESELNKIGIKLNENEKNRILKYFFAPSLILKQTSIVDKQYDTTLEAWFDSQCKWKLIYRASEHEYTASSFHQYCDHKGPTLIIIKSSEGWIFGGYTTQTWNTIDADSLMSDDKDDSKAFIFTLKNPHNIPPTKYNKRKESDCAIDCDNSRGPIFIGNQKYDICICNRCNKYPNSCIGNDGKNGYECNSIYRKSLFLNTNGPDEMNKFLISEYEVFTIDN